MTENEMLAYVGGLIDGEGCLSITSHSSNPQEHPQAYCAISNTDEGVLLIVKEFLLSFEVKSVIRKLKKYSDNHRDRFELSIRKRAHLMIFCKMLMPFLFIKTKQCQLMLSFLRIRSCQRSKTDAFKSEEYTLMAAIQAINKGAKIDVKVIDYSEDEKCLNKE